MSDRPPPPMIAGPMIRSGRLVRTTAPLAGSAARGATASVGCTRGGAWTDAVVKRLGEATASLLGPADRFPAAPLAKALVDAHRRDVRVDVLLETDTRTEPYAAAEVLANQGVPMKIVAEHAMAQNQVTGIDGGAVITEHFNFKAAREKNAENVLINRDAALAAQYRQNWPVHAQHAERSVGRGVAR